MDELNGYGQKYPFNDGDLVHIGRLGEKTPGEYNGIIRGRILNEYYIVELVDKEPELGEWTCSLFPVWCLKLRAAARDCQGSSCDEE